MFVKLLILLLLCPYPLISLAGSVDKSGLKPQVLNLPSGPGSIEGLGESFEAQLNSGTATYQVPLSVPPGRTGFSPSLALVYNGGQGNGSVGMGWRLSIPFIQRQTDKGLPVYDDVKDSFVNDKGEELVFIGDGKYRCENETSFDRFERSSADKANIAWQTSHRNGATSYFGLAETARVENNNHVFRWNLSKQVDPNGNEIIYAYNEATAFANDRVADDAQSYLTSIIYNQSTAEYSMRVDFYYETRRTHDQLFDYRSRFPVQTSQRITRIVMSAGGQRIRSYRLGYDAQTMLSRLNQVTVYGRDPNQGPLKSILHLDYTEFHLNNKITAMDLGFQPGAGLKLADVDLIDINADALPDLLHTGDTHQVYLNRDGRQWDAPYTIPGSFTEFKLGAANTMLMDMNGDGYADLFTQDVSINGYRYFSGGTHSTINNQQKFGWKSHPVEFSNSPNFTFGTETKPLDLNNDGRIDVLRKLAFSDQVACVFNQQGESYSALFTIESPSTQSEFNFSENNSTLQLADMNGDGLQDFVVLNGAGQLWYYPGRGVTQNSHTPQQYQGWDKKPRHWPESISGAEGYWMQQTPDEFDEADFVNADKFRSLRLLDINGDGMTDLVYVANNQLKAWLNRGGHEFSEHAYTIAPETGQIPALDIDTSIRTVDMNANGTIDVVWNRQTGFSDIGHSNTNWVYLDLTAGVRPNLLRRIDNGIGNITTITYKSAITDRIADRAQGREWAFKLPIALNVVAQIDIFDGLTEYSTRFRYRDGYYDGQEKEFRGFASAEQQAMGDSTAPSLVSAYQYNTGAVEKALKGKPLQMEVRTVEGKVFYRETFTWDTKKLVDGVNGDVRTVTFPFQARRVKHVLEKGSTPPVQQQWDYEYDDYGNMTRQYDHGRLDSGWDDERVTQTRYSASCSSGLSHWLLDKPIEQSTEDERSVLVAQKRNYYDGSDEACHISKGNLTKAEDWVEASHYITRVRNDYDAFGNITAIYDPLYTPGSDGHYREITYDSLFKTFPVQEKIHVDHDTTLTLSAEYDTGFGVVTSSTDFNGHKTRYGYDTFGRMISTIKPLDSKPTLEYSYVLAQPIGSGQTINYVETRQRETIGAGTMDSRKFFDGLGRHVMTRSEGEQPGQVVVSDTVQFNARKTAYKKYLPYFETINIEQQGLLDYVAPTFAQNYTEHFYDALGREIKMVQPDGSYSQIIYAPLKRTIKDEEQTKANGRHRGAGMVYEEDGLQDKNGKGRLRRVTEIFSADQQWLTRYRYDLLDNLTGYTDSQGNQKAISYDGLGRKTFMNDPDRGVMHYSYDAASNLVKTVDAKHQTIQMTYDGSNRILGEYYTSAVIGENTLADVEYHYDAAQGSLSQGAFWSPPVDQGMRQKLLQGSDSPLDYDLNSDGQFDVVDVVMGAKQVQPSSSNITASNTQGQLAWVKDTAGEEHYSFDNRGRKRWSIRVINDDKHKAHNFYTGFAYDSMDRVTELTYPDQSLLKYSYNSRGLLESIPDVITQLDYNPAGQNLHLNYANGVDVNYAYDQRLRLRKLSSTRVSDNLRLQDLSYGYDSVSNITAITDGRSNTTLDRIGSEINLSSTESRKYRATQSFNYDNLYRLTEAKNTSIYGTINYTYDQIGNMTSKTASLLAADPLMDLGVMSHGGSAGSHNRLGRSAGAAPGPHAITRTQKRGGEGGDALNVIYDDNGNVISERGQTYYWDFKDRLFQMSKVGLTGHYSYDSAGIRKYKVVKNADNQIINQVFYIDKFSEVRNDQITKYMYIGSQRIARTKNDSTIPQVYYLHDHLGSTNLVFNSSANVSEHLVNYPFGRNRLDGYVSKQSNYRFTGKETDVENGLQYFEARYLTPYLSTFNVVDPLAGELLKSWLKTPMRLNMYAYGVNNPIRYYDPSGTVDLDRVISGSWKLAGGILSIVGGSTAIAGGAAATSTGIGAALGIGSIILGHKAIAGGIVIGTLGLTQIVGGLFESDSNKMKGIDKAADIVAVATNPVDLAAKGAEVILPQIGMNKKTSKAVSTTIKLMGGVRSSASASVGILKATNKTQNIMGAASLVHSKADIVINSVRHVENEKTAE